MAEAALRQAGVEGLTLLLSESSNSGYNGRPKPYHAKWPAALIAR